MGPPFMVVISTSLLAERLSTWNVFPAALPLSYCDKTMFICPTSRPLTFIEAEPAIPADSTTLTLPVELRAAEAKV